MKKLWRRLFGEKAKYTITMDPQLMAHARDVVEDIERELAKHSPEHKHARAFARLRRLAPEASKKDVSMAIELALR